MKATIIALLIVSALATVGLTARVDPPQGEPGRGSVVTLDGDTLMGNTLPDWMEVCEETGVYGNPEGRGEVLYTLRPSEIVRVRDVNRDGTWVMVKSARWIPLGVLCWDE